jgi:hypothetical protein
LLDASPWPLELPCCRPLPPWSELLPWSEVLPWLESWGDVLPDVPDVVLCSTLAAVELVWATTAAKPPVATTPSTPAPTAMRRALVLTSVLMPSSSSVPLLRRHHEHRAGRVSPNPTGPQIHVKNGEASLVARSTGEPRRPARGDRADRP